MRHKTPTAQEAFRMGIGKSTDLEVEDKPPAWWRSTNAHVWYLVVLGCLAPALFMGLGHFIICPFSIPNGWSNPHEATFERCNWVGAQMAAIIYTFVNIVYGIVIGCSGRHLICRQIQGAKSYFERRKIVEEIGTKGYKERLREEKVAKLKQKQAAERRDVEKGFRVARERGEEIMQVASVLPDDASILDNRQFPQPAQFTEPPFNGGFAEPREPAQQWPPRDRNEQNRRARRPVPSPPRMPPSNMPHQPMPQDPGYPMPTYDRGFQGPNAGSRPREHRGRPEVQYPPEDRY